MVRQPPTPTELGPGHAPARPAGALTAANVDAAIETFLTILERAGWGFCCADPLTNTFVSMNEAFAAMHGYTVDELTGRPIAAIKAPEVRAEVWEHLRAADQRGNYNYESLHLRKDGTTFPALISVTTVRTDDGALRYRVACVQDISERRRAQDALRDVERQFHQTFLTGPHPMHISRISDGRIVEVNERFLELTGLAREEALGKTTVELGLLEPAERDRVLRRLAEQGQVNELEIEARSSSGRPLYLSVSISRIDITNEPCVLVISNDITERKRAEAALRESEERYRTLVESARDVIFELDDDRIVYVSPSCEQVLGYTRQELLGTSALQLLNHQDQAQARAIARAVVQTGGPGRGVHQMLHKNGEWRWFESTGSRFRSSSGHHHGVVIARDITERIQYEEALRQSERRFAAAFHASPIATVLGRVSDERFIDVNDQFLELTGYAREDVIGKRAADLELFENPAERQRAEDALRATEPALGLELRIRTKSGELRDIVTSITRIDLDGERCFLTMSADITERKRAQEALRESEERFRMLAEHANDMIYRYRLIEPRGFEYVSPSVTTLAGYTPEEYYADPNFPDKIIHPDDKERFEQSIDDGVSGPVELRWLRKDGSVIWTEQRNVFLYNEAGEAIAVQGIIRDITDRKLAEEALQRARDELESRVEERLASDGAAYGLTFRELTVLQLVAQGKADKEIATELGISPLTVQKHLSNILSKMKAHSRTEAGVRAVREGLLA